MTYSLLSAYSMLLLIFSAVLQENTPELNSSFSLSEPSDQAVPKLVDRRVSASVRLKQYKVKAEQKRKQKSVPAKNKSCFVYSY